MSCLFEMSYTNANNNNNTSSSSREAELSSSPVSSVDSTSGSSILSLQGTLSFLTCCFSALRYIQIQLNELIKQWLEFSQTFV